MYKYIQDTIRNNSRSIMTGMTKPQKKSFAEIVRGIFVENTPILRHLAQDKTKTTKKQGEKYSYHLGNMKLCERIEEFSLSRVKGEVKRNTIIAYDLTDLSKESAKKIPILKEEAADRVRYTQMHFHNLACAKRNFSPVQPRPARCDRLRHT